MLGFDLETTAPEPTEARIVTEALVHVGGDEPQRSRTFLADPEVEIPEEATAIHGISTERARAEGEPVARLLAHTLNDFALAKAEGEPVVAYNARYDLTVFVCECVRRGSGHLAREVLDGLLVVDPILIEKHLDRYRPKRVASHSLADACGVWGVKLESAHDATSDAVAALRLAYWLCRRGNVIRRARNAQEKAEMAQLVTAWERARVDLDALQIYQRELAAEQDEHFEGYRRMGDPKKDLAPEPDFTVPRGWPVYDNALEVAAA